MLKKIEDFIRTNGLICEGGAVVAGVSGGADSVCLLLLLTELSKSMNFRVFAAHYNHGIRGESADNDQNFVRGLTKNLGIELYTQKGDVLRRADEKGESLEQAARIMRYEFLRAAKERFGADAIAVAHHMDDQAESILLHLFRGSGLRGLAGMRPKTGDIIRPLLTVRRSEIEEYLAERQISYCTDETNLQLVGARNMLRLDVLPYIEKNINSAAVKNICAAGELLASDQDFLQSSAEAALFDARRGNGYDRKKLSLLPPEIRSRAIYTALERAGAKTDVEKAHIQAVTSLLCARTGAKVNLAHVDAWTEYDLICFGSRRNTAEYFCVPLVLEGVTSVPDGEFVACILAGNEIDRSDRFTGYIDADKLSCAAEVRRRRDGDRFFPVGAPGGRKLKQYFIDRKISRAQREAPLVACGQDIVFLPGHCVGENVKVDENTKKMLKITYIQNSEG